MKKKLQILFFFISFLFSSQTIYSNTNDPVWQTIFLTPGGGNLMDGVEAYFQLSNCNGEDVVYLKFINHNDYSVKLEWFDAACTQQWEWMYKDGEGEKKSFFIPAKTEIKGECISTVSTELVVPVKKFVADKKDFMRYSAFQLYVLIVQ